MRYAACGVKRENLFPIGEYRAIKSSMSRLLAFAPENGRFRVDLRNEKTALED
jgi:hypothetical protein